MEIPKHWHMFQTQLTKGNNFDLEGFSILGLD